MAHTFHRYKPDSEPVPGYKLTVCLGSGGFGEVWKANAPGGTEVALKIIDLTGQQGVQEFNSLRLVKKCAHPNLVPIHAYWLKAEDSKILDEDAAGLGAAASDSGANPTTQFVKPVELIIAMGLGRKCLHKRLFECKQETLPGIPAEELLEYFEGAARGIDYLNTTIGIVHGDIKPHNILVVGDGAAVCDFGLARAVESLRKTSMAPMTVAYAAPESFRGKPTVKSDQYSLAITYVELRAGRLPFDESLSPYDLMNTHVTGELDLSRLPPYEREVIRRATALNPDDRWNTCRDLSKALRKAYEADPQAALLPGAPYDDDLEAPGFIANLQADSRPSSYPHAEHLVQTRELVNHGVTPRPTDLASRYQRTQHTVAQRPGSSPAGPTTTYAPLPPTPHEPQQRRIWQMAGLAVAGLLIIGGVLFALSKPARNDPATPPAPTLVEYLHEIDRLVSQRQFPLAIENLDQAPADWATDAEKQQRLGERREQVRRAWLLEAQREQQEQNVERARQSAESLLSHFPQDAETRAFLASLDKPLPPKTTSPGESFFRQVDQLATNRDYGRALQLLRRPPPNLTGAERNLRDQRESALVERWLDDGRSLLDSGDSINAGTIATALLTDYSTLTSARLLRIRAALAQQTTEGLTVANSDLQALSGATNLSDDERALYQALKVLAQLRDKRIQPEQLVQPVLALGIVDHPPEDGRFALRAPELAVLKPLRDTIIREQTAGVIAAPPSETRLARIDQLIDALPPPAMRFLILRGETLLALKQFPELLETLARIEQATPTDDATALRDLEAWRVVFALRDPKTPMPDRQQAFERVGDLLPIVSPPRRNDLCEAVAAVVPLDKSHFEQPAINLLHAALKIEPEHGAWYKLLAGIHGDIWNPRIDAQLNSTTEPTREQWEALLANSIAAIAIAPKPPATLDAARLESMVALDLPVDKTLAKSMVDRAAGSPTDAYVQIVGAKAALISGEPADVLGGLLLKAYRVERLQPAAQAPFRRAWSREHLVVAARGRREPFAKTQFSTLVKNPYKSTFDAASVVQWLQAAPTISNAPPSAGELANLALGLHFQNQPDVERARSLIHSALQAPDAALAGDEFDLLYLHYRLEGTNALGSIVRLTRWYRQQAQESPERAVQFHAVVLDPILKTLGSGETAALLWTETASLIGERRQAPWPFKSVEGEIDRLYGQAIQAAPNLAAPYLQRGTDRLRRAPPDLAGAVADATRATQLAPQSASAFTVLAEGLERQLPSVLDPAQRGTMWNSLVEAWSKAADGAGLSADEQGRCNLGWARALIGRAEEQRNAPQLASDLQQALDAASRSETQRPADRPAARHVQARAHALWAARVGKQSEEHYRQATQLYTELLATGPRADWLAERGLCYVRALQPDAQGQTYESAWNQSREQVLALAAADATQAATLDKDSLNVQELLAHAAVVRGDEPAIDLAFAEGANLARKQNSPRLVSLLRAWADAAVATGNWNAVRNRAERFVTADTPAPLKDSLSRLAQAYRGRSLAAEEKWAEAVAAFDLASPPTERSRTTNEDLPLLVERAEARARLGLNGLPPAAARAVVDELLADSGRVVALTPSDADRVRAQAAALVACARFVDLPNVDAETRGTYRTMGLEQFRGALRGLGESPRAIDVRVPGVKLLVQQAADGNAASEADKQTRADEARRQWQASRRLAEQHQRADAVAILDQLATDHPALNLK